jgi:hypothetical protein
LLPNATLRLPLRSPPRIVRGVARVGARAEVQEACQHFATHVAGLQCVTFEERRIARARG